MKEDHTHEKVIFKNHQLQPSFIEKKVTPLQILPNGQGNKIKFSSIPYTRNDNDKQSNMNHEKLIKAKPVLVHRPIEKKQKGFFFNVISNKPAEQVSQNQNPAEPLNSVPVPKKKKPLRTCFIMPCFKCDICSIEINTSDDESFVKCEDCQNVYAHNECLRKFNLRSDNYLCTKCNELRRDFKKALLINCFICGRQFGNMIKCGNLYVHYLCYHFFPKNFSKRIDSPMLCYDYKLKVSPCNLCAYSTGHTLKCQNCGLGYHPYCGFLHNFNYYMNSSNTGSYIKMELFDYSCEDHYFYLSREGRIQIQDKEPTKKDTRTYKSKSKKEEKKENIEKKRLVKLKRPKLQKIDYQENILSFNFSKLKKIFLKKKYIEMATKLESFDWDFTEPFMKYLKGEELECYFPLDKENDFIDISRKPVISVESDKNNSFKGVLKTKTCNYYLSISMFNEQETEKKELLGRKTERYHFVYEDESPRVGTESNQNSKKDISINNFMHLSESDTAKLITLQNLSGNSNLSEIELENIILAAELSSVYNSNKELIHQYRKKLESSDWNDNPMPNNSEKIIKTFNAVQRYSSLRKKIMVGFRDKKKTIERALSFGKSVAKCVREETIKNSNPIFNEKIKSFETDCCVCMNSDLDDANPIVFCDSCNVSIHPECYGIKEIPSGDYYCEKCTLKNKTIAGKFEFHLGSRFITSKFDKQSIEKIFDEIECLLCGRRNGALKIIESDNEDFVWSHVVCALFSKSLSIKDYEKMDLCYSQKNFEHQSYQIETCHSCKLNKGELFKCCRDGCYKQFHIMCAFFEGFQLHVKAGVINKQATSLMFNFKNLMCEILCEKHVNSEFNITTQKRLREKYYHQEFQVARKINNVNENRDVLMKDGEDFSEFCLLKESKDYINNNGEEKS